MNIQRIRNLTTGRLHTEMGHVYEDIKTITGEAGIMTHMLPNACRAMEPYLREKCPDARLWNGEYDPGHAGEMELAPMDTDARAAFWKAYAALPSALSLIGSSR